jgi:thiol-disulfide isomerase/thioredoxin
MAPSQDFEHKHNHNHNPNRRRLFGMAVALFSITVAVNQADAAGIVWRTRFDEAAQEAAAQHKPMLVMVKARWCGPCHKMLKQTFPDAGLASRVAGHFVPVLIDADENPALVKSLGIEAMPTVLVVSPERKIAGRFTGFQTAAQLHARLAAYAPREVQHVARFDFRPAPIQQPAASRQFGVGPSFLKRHAVTVAPVSPDRWGLSLPPWDTLAAAREFSSRSRNQVATSVNFDTPPTPAEIASPVPNPPD